jgi:hypothetical protein
MTTVWKRYSTEHCTKANESAGVLELGKYHDLDEANVLDVNK